MAKKGAVVTDKNVRFTILTPRLIRMEWSEENQFNNSPSFVFINRNLPVPHYSVDNSGNWLEIKTDKLLLRYKRNSGKFSGENLLIRSLNSKTEFSWFPGKVDKENLRGTTRTLDGWNGGSPEKLEKGLLSKAGWVLVDDSKSFLFDDSDWPWVKERSNASNSVDWYFFGYGRDYKKCLSDYTKVAGKIPLPPKFAFGNWWSKYWIYSDYEMRKLIDEFRTFDIPLDVFIIDMDWHYTYGLNWTNPKRDPFGEPVGWTGYTWNKSLIPQPNTLLNYKEKLNIKTALNLHPASGISPDEEKYPEFYNNYKPDLPKGEYIPFKIEEKKFAETYFSEILEPLEKSGVDFWWLDWQQWPYAKTIDSLSNTWWLNYTFFTNMERQGKRPLLFHRWGGLGNHRYQIGFSGDALISWQSLDFQPYFTATASNVGYGYWSHDLGGHIPMGIKTDPELYLRWLQFGVFSPVFRTHSTKSKLIERKIWKFPDHFDAMKDAIKLRYALVPYIYKSARETYDTGVSLCRPLYYEHPFKDEAYEFKNQYYFGKDILVAPVTSPAEKESQFTYQKIWFPKGKWFEYSSGALVSGNQELTRKYTLDEIPFFIKAGSIIPMYHNVKNLSQVNNKYTLFILPGTKEKFETEIYEDNQNTPDYKSGEFAKIKITAAVNKTRIKLTIAPKSGSYKGTNALTSYRLVFPNSLPPLKAELKNGNSTSKKLKWKYDGYTLETVINCGQVSSDSETEIVLTFPENVNKTLFALSSCKGYFKRLRNVMNDFKYAAGGEFAIPDSLYQLEQTPTRINYSPATAENELIQFKSDYSKLETSLLSLNIGNSELVKRGINRLYYNLTNSEKETFAKYEKRMKSLKDHVHYNISFSSKYSGGGKTALFDSRFGTKNYLNPAWQGFEENNMELVIDLEQETKINSVSVNALQNILYWIFFPVDFEFEVSSDNKDFVKCGTLKNRVSAKEKEIMIKSFEHKFDNCYGRYLKIRVRNIGKCPDWHHGKGGQAWMFLDEIKINTSAK
ncbi:MAG: TIM-barrel domain-containing protein [Rhodothermaceae bacterium]